MAGEVAGEVAEIAVQYARGADVRKDQLGDERHGLIVRTRAAYAPGDRPRVVIDLAQEKFTLRVTGEVKWVTPLITGALVGVALHAGSHRETVQLDVLFGRRTAGPAPEPAAAPEPAPAATPRREGRPLSVAMLQPNGVLKTVLVNALSRFGQERGGWDVSVDAHAEPDGFLEALAAKPRGLAIIDCDPLGVAAEPLVAAIRSHHAWERLPLILLSSDGDARMADGHAVYLRKPVAMKAFVDLAGILVGHGRA